VDRLLSGLTPTVCECSPRRWFSAVCKRFSFHSSRFQPGTGWLPSCLGPSACQSARRTLQSQQHPCVQMRLTAGCNRHQHNSLQACSPPRSREAPACGTRPYRFHCPPAATGETGVSGASHPWQPFSWRSDRPLPGTPAGTFPARAVLRSRPTGRLPGTEDRQEALEHGLPHAGPFAPLGRNAGDVRRSGGVCRCRKKSREKS